jgi:hypothetical protein
MPFLFWLHMVAMVYDPRPVEERGHRSAAGWAVYTPGRMATGKSLEM